MRAVTKVLLDSIHINSTVGDEQKRATQIRDYSLVPPANARATRLRLYDNLIYHVLHPTLYWHHGARRKWRDFAS